MLDANIASLGAAGQGTLVDEAIQSPITNASYDAGALVGLRLWVSVYPNAVIIAPPRLVGMILPNGISVPSVLTHATRKQQEGYIWFQGQMRHAGVAGATTPFHFETMLRSARKFPVGGRFVIVLINDGATAYAATAVGTYTLDSYVREK